MCGRFTLRTPTNVLIDRFQLEDGFDAPPRFNIAPTQMVLAVRRLEGEHPRQLTRLRWGLIPFWAKDPAIANRLINARSETVAEKPAFRAAFQRRRCVVLADGYYEWKKLGKKKQPYYIRMRDERPFGFAGLWEQWRDEDQQLVETCTLLTTDANELTRDVHDRMPVILHDEDWDRWLGSSTADRAALEKLLCPYDSEEMKFDPVSTHVNSPRNDDPECARVQGQLFD